MYENYWNFDRRPFRNTPDPAFFYAAPQHEEALMKLSYAVNENMGGAMLTGPYGCGKTMLSRLLVQQLGDSHVAAGCAAHPEMTPLDLLRTVARCVTNSEQPAERSALVADAMLEQIESALEENRRDGKHTVIIVDEAHMAESKAVLETARLLLNFQRDDEFLLTLVLAGHPELAERVAGLKQLAQRIPINCTIDRFSREDTEHYIQRRLLVAGGRDTIFQPDSMNLVHSNSGGIPRRINTLCDVSLALGSAQQADHIDAGLVLEATEKFGVK